MRKVLSQTTTVQTGTTTSDSGTPSTSTEQGASALPDPVDVPYVNRGVFHDQEVPLTIFGQQNQRVNYQYNAQSINIINAGSFQDLGSGATVMLNGFIKAIDSVEAVDPNIISAQVIAGVTTHFERLVSELQQSQPNTHGMLDDIKQARASIRETTRSLSKKCEQAQEAAAQEAAKEAPNVPAIEKHLSNAKVFMAAAATLTIIAVDLMTTGGMITLLSLGYGAGITVATQRSLAGFCSQCGAPLR